MKVRSDAIWSAAASLILPASTFLVIPYLVGQLGEASFARAMTIVAVSRLAASFDLGLIALAIPRIARGAPQHAQQYVFGAWFRLAALQVSVGFALFGLASVVTSDLLPIADVDFLLAAAAASAYQLAALVGSALSAAKRFSALLGVNGVAAVVFIAAVVVSTKGASDSRSLIWANIAQFAVAAALGTLALRRRQPEPALGPVSAPPTITTSWQMQYVAAGGVAFAQLPVVIASSTNLTAGALVAIANQIGTAIRMAGMSLAPYLLASFSLSRSGRAGALASLDRVTKWWIAAVALATVAVITTCSPLIAAWLGESAPANAAQAAIAATISAAALLATLPVSSVLRSHDLLRREPQFVTLLLLTLAVSTPVVVATDSGLAMLTTLAIGSAASSAWFLLSGRRDLR